MTRRTVCHDGKQLNGWTIQTEGVRCEDSTIPVAYLGHYEEVIGKATDFRREDDGSLTFEVEHPPWLTIDPDIFEWGIYMTDLMYEVEHTKILAGGRIRCITVWPEQGNPRTSIKKE